MNFEPFYERCEQLPPRERSASVEICSMLPKIFADMNYGSIEKVKYLFSGSKSHIGRTQFNCKRKVILMLYEWLLQLGEVTNETIEDIKALRIQDVISDRELSKYYFRDFNDCIKFIDLVCSQNGSTEKNGGALQMKSIVILLWNFVDLNEMPSIRKSDIDTENKIVKIRGNNARDVALGDYEISVLREFATRDRFNSIGGGYSMFYCSSPYLFRSSKSPQIDYNSIFCYIKKFNSLSEKYKRCISASSIRQNSVFCRILDDEVAGAPAASLISDVIGCDASAAHSYAQTYRWWKSMFVKEGA